MKRSTLLLLLTAVGVFYAWRSAQAAPAANGAATPAAPGPGLIGFGEDLVLPPADPYARAELDAGPDSGGSSVLGGKLDWPFFVAVGASNAKNRRILGGITADHLLPVEPIGAPAAASSSSSSSYSAPSSGGYQGGGGFQPKGGGYYAIP